MKPLIAHIKSFSPISADKLSSITEKFFQKSILKKKHILLTGDRVNEVHFIVSGCVRTYVYGLNGAEHNITFSMENWWFGDLQGFINNTPASFNIQTLEDTIVLSISKENWDILIHEIPEFVSYTRILFRNTMFAHENRILQNLSYTAEERYQYFLKQYPSLSQRISQKHIASYLGITPEFLSMIRSRKKR